MQSQIAALRARVEFLEQQAVAANARAAPPVDPDERKEQIKKLVQAMTPAGNSPPNEDWFWSAESTGEEIPLTFAKPEGFAVDAMTCRGEWCRVEIQDTADDTGDLVSDLNLQLRINDSLGRDTIIRSGGMDGNRRVLFIR